MRFETRTDVKHQLTITDPDGGDKAIIHLRHPNSSMQMELAARCTTSITNAYGKASPEEVLRIYSRWMVTGWENVQDHEGKEIEFTEANLEKVWEMWPVWIHRQIHEFGMGDPLDRVRKEAEGNSNATSDSDSD